MLCDRQCGQVGCDVCDSAVLCCAVLCCGVVCCVCDRPLVHRMYVGRHSVARQESGQQHSITITMARFHYSNASSEPLCTAQTSHSHTAGRMTHYAITPCHVHIALLSAPT